MRGAHRGSKVAQRVGPTGTAHSAPKRATVQEGKIMACEVPVGGAEAIGAVGRNEEAEVVEISAWKYHDRKQS